MLSGCTCFAMFRSNRKKTPAVFVLFTALMYLPFFPTSRAFLLLMQNSCSHVCCFYRQCTAVTGLFSQVEVGDIIRVNGSDFVPADAVILSTRYRSPTCCQTLWNFTLLFFFLLSQLSLKK